MKKVFPLLILLLSNLSISQDQTTNLDEVVVLSTKIDLPFSKNFRTVTIISSEDIKKYFNTTEILNREALPLRLEYKQKVQEYFKNKDD